MKKIRQE